MSKLHYEYALNSIVSEIEKIPGVQSVSIIDGLGYPVLRPQFIRDHIFWEEKTKGFTASGDNIRLFRENGMWRWSLNYSLNWAGFATREECIGALEEHMAGRGFRD